MADEKVIYGRTRLRAQASCSLSYDGPKLVPAVPALTENIVTFDIGTFHVVDGIPQEGPAPVVTP